MFGSVNRSAGSLFRRGKLSDHKTSEKKIMIEEIRKNACERDCPAERWENNPPIKSQNPQQPQAREKKHREENQQQQNQNEEKN